MKNICITSAKRTAIGSLGKSLKNVNAPLSGIVLNAVTQKNTYGSYYYYYYQYYNYYGSQDTKSA